MPGQPLEQRFTLAQVEAASSREQGPGAFTCAKGVDDLNGRRAELSSILCRERPDLFVESGGIQFGVVATMGGMQDWPGSRYGTFALYVVTLGCWPVSLEEHMPGVAYLYVPRQPERALAKQQLMCGYKCNLSVFSPLGLLPGLNGFPECKGTETTGTWSPAPDSEKTAPVFLTEIARAVAEAMTPAVQAKIAASAKALAGEDAAPAAPATDAKGDGDGYVDVIGGRSEMGREIYFFVNGDESRPAPFTVGGQQRAAFAAGTHIFAYKKVEQSVTLTITAKSITQTPGLARISWLKTPVRVASGKITVITVTGSKLEVSAPMSRNDAEMFKIRYYGRTSKPDVTTH
jgi:hypothetical protein